MQVLFLRSNPVDPDSRVEKEAETFLKHGIEVEIFCWDRSSDHGIHKERKQLGSYSCPIYRVGFESIYGAGFKRNIRPLLRFQISIGRFLKKYHTRYDVIHACDFDTCHAAYKYCREYGLKLVYDIFDYYVDSAGVPGALKKLIESIDHHLINNADATIICSEERQKQIAGTKPKKLVVIHNTPMSNVNNRLNDYSTDSSRCRIAYVGILNDGRLLKELIGAVAKDKRFELHIGGFGKYEDQVSSIADKNSNIIFYGKVPYGRTLEIESSCDILTAIYDPDIPNHKYAAPNKFYEALMLGKPLIMVKGTGMSQYVKDNNIGVLIDYSEKGLEQGLNLLLNQKSEWTGMSERAKKLYAEEFSWDVMEERLIGLYENL